MMTFVQEVRVSLKNREIFIIYLDEILPNVTPKLFAVDILYRPRGGSLQKQITGGPNSPYIIADAFDFGIGFVNNYAVKNKTEIVRIDNPCNTPFFTVARQTPCIRLLGLNLTRGRILRNGKQF